MRKKRLYKKRRSKESSEILHFKKRMIERHKMVLTTEQIYEIAAIIKNGKHKLVEKQTNRVSVYDTTYHDKKLRIVYDKLRHVPVTVYEDSWI